MPIETPGSPWFEPVCWLVALLAKLADALLDYNDVGMLVFQGLEALSFEDESAGA